MERKYALSKISYLKVESGKPHNGIGELALTLPAVSIVTWKVVNESDHEIIKSTDGIAHVWKNT